ncbi:MAG TPA: hypothetical protein VNW47_06660 [Terriglobales bacterium]|jgi:hypothetical protein|nr:hypothetical protein [Terriglobales bacterium]
MSLPGDKRHFENENEVAFVLLVLAAAMPGPLVAGDEGKTNIHTKTGQLNILLIDQSGLFQ